MRSSGAVSRLLAADRPYRLVVAQISAGALTAEAAEAQQHRDEDEQAERQGGYGQDGARLWFQQRTYCHQ